jgi:hypothetical protein
MATLILCPTTGLAGGSRSLQSFISGAPSTRPNRASLCPRVVGKLRLLMSSQRLARSRGDLRVIIHIDIHYWNKQSGRGSASVLQPVKPSHSETRADFPVQFSGYCSGRRCQLTTRMLVIGAGRAGTSTWIACGRIEKTGIDSRTAKNNRTGPLAPSSRGRRCQRLHKWRRDR